MKDQNIEEQVNASRRWLIRIGCLHAALLLSNCGIIYVIGALNWPNVQAHIRPLLISALFGLLGSTLYFSRKCYVYLITNKLAKVIRENRKQEGGETDANNVLCGYYMYLILRPIAGIAIGPILYMLAATSVITIAGKSVGSDSDISQSGRYLIYTFAFLGGHAASDMFDYFSWMARSRLTRKTKKEES